jgi:hypothetical protein
MSRFDLFDEPGIAFGIGGWLRRRLWIDLSDRLFFIFNDNCDVGTDMCEQCSRILENFGFRDGNGGHNSHDNADLRSDSGNAAVITDRARRSLVPGMGGGPIGIDNKLLKAARRGGLRMTAAPDHVLHCDAAIFQRDLNVLPYEIQHTLAGHPLFQLPKLAELAQRVAARRNPHMSGGDAYFNEGAIDPGTKPNYDRPEEERARVAELVKKIESAEAWIILKHIEREEGYREVMEAAVCDALKLAGEAGERLLRKIKWFEAIVFITSPNRVTEYHIDRECSWIFQIRGDKRIHLFDRADKDVVPEEELERFYTVDNHASQYKPQFEERALVYDMSPGSGVHIPVNTPHWLKNGNNVSITLNVNFHPCRAGIAWAIGRRRWRSRRRWQ